MIAPATRQPCEECEGTGYLDMQTIGWCPYRFECPLCGGSGENAVRNGPQRARRIDTLEDDITDDSTLRNPLVD